jgi:hypothetical protein
MPTNMTEAESKHYLGLFDPYLTDREEEFISEIFTHYLFYETWGRKGFRECVCTHCGCGRFEVDKAENPNFFKLSHGDHMECPKCGEPVELIALGRMRTFASLEEMRRVTLCRASKDGALLLISGWAKKEYSWDDLRPVVWFNEKIRTCLLPGRRMQWQKCREWNGHIYKEAGWTERSAVNEPFAQFMYSSDGSYYLISPECIQNTALRYCQLNEWYYDVTKVDIYDNIFDPVKQVIRYLSAYTQYPAIEMAVKLGLTDAVEELVCDGCKNHKYINWKANNPAEFLRMSKADAKAFIKSEGQLKQLRIYDELFRSKSIANINQYLELVMLCGGANNLVELNKVAKDAGLTLKKACQYIRKVSPNGETIRVIRIWKDYIDMAMTLGYDLEREDVLMPKNLEDRHDQAAATIKVQLQEEKDKQYRARYKQLKKLYEFAMDDLCIIVPETAQQIIFEGNTLHHCVGGYADRHINGKVDILFLRHRKKPEKSYITIEMHPRGNTMSVVHMVQIHGYKNERYKNAKSPLEKHGYFIETWMEWLRHGSKRDKKGRPILPAVKEKSA